MKQLIKHIIPSSPSFRAPARKLLLLLALMLVGVVNVFGQLSSEEGPLNDHTGALSISRAGNNISNGKFVYNFTKEGNTLVTFTLSLDNGDITKSTTNLYLGNGERGKNKSAHFSWSVADGYSINVSKVTINTFVLSTTSARCRLGTNASNSSGTVVNDASFPGVSIDNPSNNLLISYYYPGGRWDFELTPIDARATYISTITITFTLTHKNKIYYFKATTDTWDSSTGTARVGLNTSDVNHSSVEATVKKLKTSSPTSATCDAYYTATAPNADYQFIGWGTTQNATTYVSTQRQNYRVRMVNSSPGTRVDSTRYAIFAKYKINNPNAAPFTSENNQLVIDFGKVAYNSARIDRVFTIDAHNVGTSISQTGLDGSLFSAAISNFKNDNSNHVCSVKVTLNPSVRSGVVRDTLNISTPRGGTISVVVKADIDPKPTFTWNDQIWDANGNQIKTPIYVDDPILENIVSSNSTGDTTCTVREIEVYGTNNESAVFPTFSNNQITCGKAGRFEFKVDQAKEDGNGYEASSSSRTLRIIKRTPEVEWNSAVPYYFNETYPNANYSPVYTLTSGDATLIDTYASTDLDVATFVEGVVTTYNVDRSTTLSIHLAENYKWKEWTFTNTIRPRKKDNHVPFVINNTNVYDALFYYKNMSKNHYNTDEGSNGAVQLGPDDGSATGAVNWDDRITDICFTGIPDKLSFHAYTSTGAATGVDFRVYESSDGIHWGTHIWKGESHDQTLSDIQLQSSTRYLRLYYTGNFRGFFENVTVTELQIFKGEPNPIDFGKVPTDEHPVDYIYFEHANAGYKVEVTSSLPSIFVVDPTVIPNTGGDKMGGEYCQVTFHPENATLNVETVGYITFSDQLGNTTSVTVKGYATSLQVPKFTWNPLNMPYYCASTEPGAPSYYSIPNICSSSNNGPNAPLLKYTSDNASSANVVNGELRIYVRDDASRPYPTITITVHQDGVANEWEEKTQKFTFTPHKKADISVPFFVTKEIFEDAYALEGPTYSHLFGTVKEKGYEWDSQNEEFRLGSSWLTADVSPHPAFDWANEKSVTFNFEGTPYSVTFSYKLIQSIATSWESGQGDLSPQFKVFESTDGTTWTPAASIGCSSTSYSTATVPLLPTSSFIKLAYQGNYGGLLKDVSVSALDGYYFLKSGDKYLSRGDANRDKAVLDDYGIAVRKILITDKGNSERFINFQHVDNEKYLCENNGVFITNSEEKRTFTETKYADGTFVFKSENDKKQYLKVNGNSLGQTTDIAQATHWKQEEADAHSASMTNLRNSQVYSATNEFGELVTSYAKLRERLENEDYDRDTVFTYVPEDAQEQYQGSLDNRSVVYTQRVQNNIKLIPGLYCLNVKAFYRIGPNDRAYKVHDLGYDSPVAYVSLKDESNGDVAITQIVSLYDFHDNKDNYTGDDPFFKDYQVGDAYYPNCLESAKKSFARRFVYDNDVFLYVDEKAGGLGDVTISIVAPSNSNDFNWLCYKDITLTRLYRKEYTFDGNPNSNGPTDDNWKNGQNWIYEGVRGTVPEKMHKVVIAAPAVVGNGANAGAYKITFDSQVQNSSVTVKAGGSLSVREGGFVGATHSNLVLEADGNGQTGALLLHPEMEDMPNATVQFYSTIANKKTDKEWQWQYIGTPIKNPDTNEHIFYQCWLFQHSIEDDEWTNAGNWGHMEPFRGYAFTRDNYRSSGPLFGFCGQLNDARRKELPLSYVVKNGNVHNENQIANSWTAPIRLSNLTEEDFIGVDPNIYYYQRDGQGVTSIGPFSAKYTGMDVIPAMQGFFVKTTEEKGEKQHKLVLDYKRLVWDFEKEELFRNEPLKAPSREHGKDNDELLSRVCINLMSADSIPDHLYLLEKEGEGFSRDFTEGYDAPKYFVDGLPCIYTYETSGNHLAVSATDDVVGTYLAINTNASQNYTLTFSKVIGEGLGLRDLVTNTIVPITEGMQYAFTAPANSSPMLRFVVVEHEETPQWNNNNGTSLEDVGGEFKIWQSGEILSVIGAGSHASLRLYDSAGKLILSEFFNEATAINLNALPTGVYMVQVNDKTEKVLR